MTLSLLERRRRNNAYMKALHRERRAAGLCINNPKHGRAVMGGRCEWCWDKKKATEVAAYAEGRRVP